MESMVRCEEDQVLLLRGEDEIDEALEGSVSELYATIVVTDVRCSELRLAGNIKSPLSTVATNILPHLGHIRHVVLRPRGLLYG